jgi:hypothetical protein
MKRTLHLIGPYVGQIIDMADAAADISVTDGWGRLVANQPYPYNSSGEIAARHPSAYPNSLKIWIASTQPLPPLNPDEELIPVVSATKANPTVIEVAEADIDKFSDGDFVQFFRTGTMLDTTSASVQNLDDVAFTFEVAINTTGGPDLLPTGVVINLST